MAINTTNLNIPLLDGADLVDKDGINKGFEAVDRNAAPSTHVVENSHWKLWAENTAYQKQDVFRTSTIPSWGFWEVKNAGTSGNIEPVGYGEGDTFTDGNIQLVLRRLTTAGVVNDWRLWKEFESNYTYDVGDIFRTRTCPSWGYWLVTKLGVSKNEPYGNYEGATAVSGTMECELKRFDNSGIRIWEQYAVYSTGIYVVNNGLIYRCNTAHTSGINIDVDKTKWDLINYKEFRLWSTFKENYTYNKGDIFKTENTPLWGYWYVTSGGTTSTVEPAGTNEGDIDIVGTAVVQLARIINSNEYCTKRKAVAYSFLF